MSAAVALAQIAPAVLVVTSKEEDSRKVDALLGNGKFRMMHAHSPEEASRLMRTGQVAVVISKAVIDHDSSWRDILAKCRLHRHPPKLIVVTPMADEKLWLDVLEMGGFDLFDDGHLDRHFRSSVDTAVHDWLAG